MPARGSVLSPRPNCYSNIYLLQLNRRHLNPYLDTSSCTIMRSATMETVESQQPAINGNAHLAASHIKAQKPPKRHMSTHLTASYPSQSLRFLQKLENLKSYNIEEDASIKRPTQARLRLNIVIVGAGLGGLSLAIALARRGHSVRVLEQAATLGEVSPHFYLLGNPLILAGGCGHSDPPKLRPTSQAMGRV